MNEPLRRFLCSGVSQRRLARSFHLSRTTVARKLLFLGAEAKLKLAAMNFSHRKSSVVEFDEMESFEHTKCKPLSIPLMVEFKSRRILGFKVARMPAKGPLAHISRKKYGTRIDERKKLTHSLLDEMKDFIEPRALIKSDQNPHYPNYIKRHFPFATHQAYKGKRGAVTGQGELKKIGFDPIFSFNHTAAMLRANINRLFRRTWCTTKKPERLEAHIYLYAVYHNEHLKI